MHLPNFNIIFASLQTCFSIISGMHFSQFQLLLISFTKSAKGNSCTFLFKKFKITQKSIAYPLAYLNCLITFVVSSKISSISLYGGSLQCYRYLKMHII